jgi:hypothetical protein
MNTVHGMFASSDEQELRAMVREVDELRRARGRQQLGPWWQIQRKSLFRPRQHERSQPRPPWSEEPVESTP